MQDLIIATKTCRDEQGAPHTFQYTLLIGHIPVGRFSFEEYGVAVSEVGGDCARLPGITHSRSRIDALLTLLMDHTVSPTGLFDVVEDWAKENHLPQAMSRQVVHIE